ncbi:hypothetical protein VTK73DRAFT_395 [Phialemonium thermophilum]|uniref:Golgi apyrase n=1 Tax=Phialemonium thermophilum TaxID=223376 RepID=A0ABR3XFG9_9PEZI
MGKKWRYGVILDAGSSGTRLHIYRWSDPRKEIAGASKDELNSLPRLVTKKEWTKKIRPGVSTFADKPASVGPDHLQTLIDHAIKYIPEDDIEDTPFFLMATAGMRLLPKVQQTALAREICSYVRKHTDFYLPDCSTHIQVIPGETEGLYGWLASNYLLGGFDHPDQHNHGKGHHTYGFLDMGGASAQIAFAPNTTEAVKHANDLKLLRLRALNGTPREYKVFTATWLGFGVNQAREAYVKALLDAYATPNNEEIPDPCMPKGLRTNVHGETVEKHDSKHLTLLGTGNFDECLRKTYPLLGKDAPCEDEPCLLNGQHVPAIDFDINHFIGVSEYWHTTHGVFGTGGDKAYDFATYQRKVKDFCSQDWYAIESKVGTRRSNKAKDAQEACFKASWLINVLHEGIGIPRLGLEQSSHSTVNSTQGALEGSKNKGLSDAFQPVDKIDGIEVSWTLGKMLLYSAGQIPPNTKDDSLPVGFGSNVPGVPPDFQHAGSSWRSSKDAGDHDDDWSDTAEEFMDKARSKSASGFLAFILVLLLISYVFRRRDRRMRLFGAVGALVRRTRRPGSPRRRGSRVFSEFTSKFFSRQGPSYERVMEEGAAEQFELGGGDSEDAESSDSSDSVRFGQSSGLTMLKPSLDVPDPNPSGLALDRNGLAVRTESRERLGPAPQMLNAGRRSRAGSPTRLKSPFVPAFQGD